MSSDGNSFVEERLMSLSRLDALQQTVPPFTCGPPNAFQYHAVLLDEILRILELSSGSPAFLQCLGLRITTSHFTLLCTGILLPLTRAAAFSVITFTETPVSNIAVCCSPSICSFTAYLGFDWERTIE